MRNVAQKLSERPSEPPEPASQTTPSAVHANDDDDFESYAAEANMTEDGRSRVGLVLHAMSGDHARLRGRFDPLLGLVQEAQLTVEVTANALERAGEAGQDDAQYAMALLLQGVVRKLNAAYELIAREHGAAT